MEHFLYVGFPSMPQAGKSFLDVIVQRGIKTNFSICTEDWVRWCNGTRAQVLSPKALQRSLVHSPPPHNPPCPGAAYATGWSVQIGLITKLNENLGFKVSRWTRLDVSHPNFLPALQERKRVLAHHFVSTVLLQMKVLCSTREVSALEGSRGNA